MSGLFDDLDVAGAEEFTFPELKAGVYEGDSGQVIIQHGSKANEDAVMIVIKYNLGEVDGVPLTQWEYLTVPPSPKVSPWRTDVLYKEGGKATQAEQYARFLGAIKSRLKDLGVPLERMNEVLTPDENEHLPSLENIPCIVTIKPQKNNPQYMSIAKVALPGSSGTSLPTASAPSAAPASLAASAPAAAMVPGTAAGATADPWANLG